MDNRQVMEHKEEEAYVREWILRTQDWIKYFLSKKYIILLFGILGGGLGLVYAFIKKPVYTATTSFVLETGDNKSALAAYAGLASSFGIDLGVSGGGLFEGDNILELYKSRNMIGRTLLSEAVFDGKKQLLIDRFIEHHELRKKWEDEPELNGIRFQAANIYTDPRQQILHDSIISKIVKTLDKNYLSVNRIDKKLNIIEVRIISTDELFAKYFNERLVENVNKFYLDTKTKRALENVIILQHKTDSVRGILSGSINRAAAVADATPNQNPARMAQRVAPIENATANAEINKEVLGTLLQNLELSKISLSKETPLIQIVDQPILPLEKNKTGKLFGLIAGGFIGGFIVMIFLMIKRVIKTALTEE